MVFTRSRFNSFKPKHIKLKNKLNNDIIEGILINEDSIDGQAYFVIKFLNGTVNKFNKEAFTVVKSTIG